MSRFDLAVVGLGYVGLPLARAACAAGLAVAGLDTSAEVVNALASGRSHILGVADGDVADMLDAGFAPGRDADVLRRAQAVAVCVPTGLRADAAPDLGPLTAAVRTAAVRVEPGTVVVVESTSFPGTVQEVVRPLFERAGFTVGEDLYLGCSPERIDPGNGDYGIENTPKIVSGCTPACAKRIRVLYERFVRDVAEARGTREAELAKLLENTYRAVNIALVNSFAVYCHRVGIDVWDVLRLADTKPFGYQAFRPGPGVGGHCIPVDPAYLVHRAAIDGFDFALVREAERVNAQMPAHVVRRILDLLAARGADETAAERARPAGDGAAPLVLLLGVAYKPDVDDVRESPALVIAAALRQAGMRIEYHDPHVDRLAVDGLALPHARDPYEAAGRADLAVLLQPHRAYDLDRLARCSRLLFDATGYARGERIIRL